MKLRQVLARRLRDLMERTPGLETQMQVSAAAGISQTTVSRILKAQVAATLDNVEAIADAYGMQGGDLLTQTPTNSHVISDEDRRTMQRIAAYLAISEGGSVSAKTIHRPRTAAANKPTKIPNSESHPIPKKRRHG